MRVLIDIAAGDATTRTIKITDPATGAALVADYAAPLPDAPLGQPFHELLERVRQRGSDALPKLGAELFRALLAPAWPTLRSRAVEQVDGFVRLELRF